MLKIVNHGAAGAEDLGYDGPQIAFIRPHRQHDTIEGAADLSTNTCRVRCLQPANGVRGIPWRAHSR